MSRKYILVDFENVQPSSLGALKAGDAYVKVFAGAHQNRVDLALAQALQPFGTHAEYIQIVGSGKDALDFHIAFYIGRLSAEHPGAMAVVLTNGSDGNKWMNTFRPRATFRDATGHIGETVTTTESGWGSFRCRGGSVSVWLQE